MVSIGDNLRAERARKGWNLGELARRSTVSISAIHDCERGRRIPHTSNLIKIADALGVSLDTLLQPAAAPSAAGPVNTPARESVGGNVNSDTAPAVEQGNSPGASGNVPARTGDGSGNGGGGA